jgi:hypothetical protein
MPDIAMEAENVEPTGLDNDYLSCLPASRLRAIGMGRNLGTVPLIMCQADRHWDDNYSPFCVPQMVGWVLAHDCLPENSAFWDVLAVESQIGRDDVVFRPYWKPDPAMESLTPKVLVSAHTRPGHALLWIVNTTRQDRRAQVAIAPQRLGFGSATSADRLRVIDAETGELLSAAPVAEQRLQISLDVPARFWRAVRIVAPRRLKKNDTFTASFDDRSAEADEAIGYVGSHQWKGTDAFFVTGRKGRGVMLDQPLSYLARHHVRRDAGRIQFHAKFDPATARGTLLRIDRLSLSLDRGTWKVMNDKETLQELPMPDLPDTEWHDMRVSWQDDHVQIHASDHLLTSVRIRDGMPIKQQTRGLEIYRGRQRAELALISFGPLRGAVLDDVVMGTP